MASTIQYGSKGNDVTTLQNLLNQQGYGLSVDGIFGTKTQEAVRDYQQRSGLAADGIVGTNTWGSLTGSTGSPGPSYSAGGLGGTSYGGGAGTASGGAYSYGGEMDNPLYGYEQLLSGLAGGIYQQRSDAELLEEARNYYTPTYNAQKQAQQQQYDQALLALERQLAQLAPAYDRQREDTAAAYAGARSQADRQALSRGMQRSSYNNQTLANIDTQGARAQDDIGAAQARGEADIAGQQALAARQLAQVLARLDTDLAAQIAAEAAKLRSQEYDRHAASRDTANQNALELYRLGLQQAQWERELAEQQRQYNASLAAKSSGSGGSTGGSGGSSSGSGGKSPSSSPKGSSVQAAGESALERFLISLYGNGGATTVSQAAGGLPSAVASKTAAPKKKEDEPIFIF